MLHREKKKTILFQSLSIFSCPRLIVFQCVFQTKKAFSLCSTIWHHKQASDSRWFRATHIPFCFSFSYPSHKVVWGFSRDIFCKMLHGKSSTISVCSYLIIQFLTNDFHFFHIFSGSRKRHFDPFGCVQRTASNRFPYTTLFYLLGSLMKGYE